MPFQPLFVVCNRQMFWTLSLRSINNIFVFINWGGPPEIMCLLDGKQCRKSDNFLEPDLYLQFIFLIIYETTWWKVYLLQLRFLQKKRARGRVETSIRAPPFLFSWFNLFPLLNGLRGNVKRERIWSGQHDRRLSPVAIDQGVSPAWYNQHVNSLTGLS